MLATLSYNDQNVRKQIQIPYYEIENVTQEIYENCKQTDDFDFTKFEQQYTYFKPYLDYILLQKQGRLNSFLMDRNNSIYAENHELYYFSNKETRIHNEKKIVHYLCADDKSIMLNQENNLYNSILLSNATSLSYKEATFHDLLFYFYFHQVLSKNKDVALYYDEWKEHELPSYYKQWLHDHEQTFLCIYLGVIRYTDLGNLKYYFGANEMETNLQRQWLEKRNADPITITTNLLSEEQIETDKQFIKSFS